MQNITHQNLEADLVNASLAQPVLLDIWAPWCGPCKTLGPTLERLETSYGGRFKLVKLNADDEPEIAQQLSQMFGVRSIPFCVLFKGGQPVDGFVGALPEAEVRKFLDKHVPSEEEQAAEDEAQAGGELLEEGDTDAAIDRLQAALATNPANDSARYDYLRALLEAGHVAEARAAFDPVAAIRCSTTASPPPASGSRRWKPLRRHARATRSKPRWRRTSATSRPASSWRRSSSPSRSSRRRWISCSRS